MAKFLSNINLETANDIQFKTTAGANAGKISQDGNNLVLSNAVGDVLLGDGASDIYIGDGTNNVDILFEQSGSIKGDGSAITLTLGGTNTTLNLENPNINGSLSIGATTIDNKLTFTTNNGYILFDYEPTTSGGEYSSEVPLLRVDRSGTELTILSRVSNNGAVILGNDDGVAILAGDVKSVIKDNLNLSAEEVVIAAEGGWRSYSFPSNDTTWSNRNEFRFYGADATAANNGLYIGDGGSTQFIDLSRNLTVNNITASGDISNINEKVGTNVYIRNYELATGGGSESFLIGKIEHGTSTDGAISATVHFAHDYGTTTNNCTLHFNFAQRSGTARGTWWYEGDDQDVANDRVHARVIDDGSGDMYVWITCADFAAAYVEARHRFSTNYPSSGTLTAATITSGTTLFDTANDPTAEMHIGTLYAHGSIIKNGGSSGEFLKADGSVDSNTYLTSQTSHSDVLVDGDFTSQGFMKRGSSAGSYSIDTNTYSTATGVANNADVTPSWVPANDPGYLTSQTSHSDVLVDGDFGSAGFMKTDGAGTYSIDTSTYITSQRAIDDTPVNGSTTTSISSNWAFDNVKTAVPSGAVFTDTVNTLAIGTGANDAMAGNTSIPSISGLATETYVDTAESDAISAAATAGDARYNLVSGNLTVDSKRQMVLPSNSTQRGPFQPLAAMIRGAGTAVYGDEDFNAGENSVNVYNNQGGTGVAKTRETDQTTLNQVAPNSSGYVIKFVNNGNATSPLRGGFYQTISSSNNKTFVQVFQAKIPATYSVALAENAQGTNNTSYFLTDTAGTGKFEWYVRVSHCGDSGSFSSGGHIYLSGGSAGDQFTWYLASSEIYNVTDAQAKKLRNLSVTNDLTVGGDITVTGDLTVNGTTTTIDTTNLNVEDNNITLNYNTGDSSSSADGAGITIQDAVDASTNATMLWDATNDRFVFSHGVVSGSTVLTGDQDISGIATNASAITTNATAITNNATAITAAGTYTQHENISAASSSDNSGNTFIQDLTIDSNGHITGLSTATASFTETYTAHESISAASSSDNSGNTFIQDLTIDSNGHITGLATGSASFTETYTAHENISAATSVNGSGRQYIQDITVDSNGHVTGIATATETVVNTNTNKFLSGISKPANSNVMTFTVTGGTNQSFTFGSNAFNSTSIPTGNAVIDWSTSGEEATIDSSYYTNTVYTHPTYTTTNINTSGSTIVDSITTNSTGHITAMGTRTLSLGDLGFTGNSAADCVLNSTQTLGNKTLSSCTIDFDSNTISNIEVGNFKASSLVLEAEGIGSNDNDTSIPTSAAVKDYVDNNSSSANYYLDGISKSSNTLTFSVNGATNQTYEFGANAFNSTAIPSISGLATTSYVDTAESDAISTASADATTKADAALASAQSYADTAETDAIAAAATAAAGLYVPSSGTTTISGTKTITGSLILDDGTGASPTMRFMNEDDDEVSIFCNPAGKMKFQQKLVGGSNVVQMTMDENGLVVDNGLKVGSGATITTILDEDAMGSNSATALATQQSIKAYVTSAVAGAGGGTMSSWNLDSDANSAGTITQGTTVSIDGGTGITTSRSGSAITITNGITNNNQLTNGANYTTNTGTTTASNTQTFTNKSGNISQWTNDSNYTTNTGTTTASNTQTFTNKSGDISQWTNDSSYLTSVATSNIGNNAVTMAKLKDLAKGRIIVGNSSNETSELAVGTVGHVLTVQSGSTLGWSASSGGSSYSLPTSSTSTLGGVKLGSDTALTQSYNAGGAGSSNRTYPVQLNSSNQMGVSVPWSNTNTTYSAGNGIGISSTTFSVSAGGALGQETSGLTLDVNGKTNLFSVTPTASYRDLAFMVYDPDDSTYKKGFLYDIISAMTVDNQSYTGGLTVGSGTGGTVSPANDDTKIALGIKLHGTSLSLSSDGLKMNDTQTSIFGTSLKVGRASNSMNIDFGNTDSIDFKNNTTICFRADNSGNIYFTTTWYQGYTFSDLKLKENVRSFYSGLDTILKLKPVVFDWKKEEAPDNVVGFIAQDVEKVMPNAVKKLKKLENNEEIEYLNVDNSQIVATLTKAVQEQQKQIDELKQIINGLTK